MIDATKYPQIAKMQEVQEASQAIGEFLEWLDEQRIGLASVIRGDGHDRWAPITDGHEKLIARHFGIDLNAVERERRAVLSAHVSGAKVTKHEYEGGKGRCTHCGLYPTLLDCVERNAGVSAAGHQTKSTHTPMGTPKC